MVKSSREKWLKALQSQSSSEFNTNHLQSPFRKEESRAISTSSYLRPPSGPISTRLFLKKEGVPQCSNKMYF